MINEWQRKLLTSVKTPVKPINEVKVKLSHGLPQIDAKDFSGELVLSKDEDLFDTMASEYGIADRAKKQNPELVKRAKAAMVKVEQEVNAILADLVPLLNEIEKAVKKAEKDFE